MCHKDLFIRLIMLNQQLTEYMVSVDLAHQAINISVLDQIHQ